MKNDLNSGHLAQEVTLKLPLSAVLRLAERPIQSVDLNSKLQELKSGRPNLGDRGLYGIYAGIARADDQGGDHIVEVLDEIPKPMKWTDAMAWAESIGGTLPTRKEQALLFANVPELFEKEWYWSCEQYAGIVAYAWCQSFDFGYQTSGHECYELRARAVRRLTLE